MSTYTYPTTATRGTDAEPTYQPSVDHRSDDRSTPTTDRDADSWVARCQSQFDATRTDRLGNLVDAENQAMPTGTTPPRDP